VGSKFYIIWIFFFAPFEPKKSFAENQGANWLSGCQADSEAVLQASMSVEVQTSNAYTG